MRWLGLLCGMAICIGVSGCNVGDMGGRQETGSGTVKSETRPVSGFDAVTLNGPGKILIKQDGNESLTVSAEDNLLPLLKTEVTNGNLHLDIEPGVKLQPTKPIEYKIETRQMATLTATGTGDIQADGINGKQLTVTLSGAAKVALAGKVTDVNLKVIGTSNVDAANLQAQQATIDSSGVGHVVINASDQLNVTISGVGGVEYLGSPHVQKKIYGRGKVTRRK